MTYDEIKKQIEALSTEDKRHILRFLEREIAEARHFEDKFCGGPGDMIVDGKYFDENADGGKGAWLPVGKKGRSGEKSD